MQGEDKSGKRLKDKHLRRPPSRRLVRHVLRVRAEAMRLLAAYLLTLSWEEVKVPVSLHMVKIFGEGVQPPSPFKSTTAISEASYDKVEGRAKWNGGIEIGPLQIKYLSSRDRNKVKELLMQYARGHGTARVSELIARASGRRLVKDDASPCPEEEELMWVPLMGHS